MKKIIFIIFGFIGSLLGSNIDSAVCSVSYIYYPYAGYSRLDSGHSELEVDGKSYDCFFDDDQPNVKNLTDMILIANQRGRKPFYRFVFKVNAQNIDKIKKILALRPKGCTCSAGVLNSLQKADICHVPFPLQYSPLLSSIYLTMGKKLRLNNVISIEYYGRSFEEAYIKNMFLKGIAGEILTIAFYCVGIVSIMIFCMCVFKINYI